MAVNALFQTYKRQEVFNVKIVNNRNNNRNTASMAQRGGRRFEESDTGKPQAKRRRLDHPQTDEAGDWDDSFEMTQQDLESLDVIASQAIGEPQTTSKEEADIEHKEADQTLTLDLTSAPVTSVRVTEGEGQSGFFQTPAPGATVRLKNRSSTSSSSDSSVYPQSSASFRKTLSSDMSSVAGSLTSKSSENSVGETTVVTPGPSASSANIVTLTSLREELRKKNEETQKAQNELYAKDGEVKFLKESLHKQEQELEKLRAEREERKDVEEQRLKEHEKELKQEVGRLQTQIQFKAQDCVELQQKCHTLESKLRQQSSSTAVAQPSTSAGVGGMSQPAASPDKSPRVRKVVPKSSRTPEKGAFPSHQSFMSTSVSPSSPAAVACTTQNKETMTVADWQAARPSPSQRRLQLNVPCPRGKTPGSQLVSQLLQCGCSSSKETEGNGILGLLQTLPSRLDLELLQYERDDVTLRLSPIKKARRLSSPGIHTPQQTQPTRGRPLVDRINFLLAVQGLRNLINSSQLDHPTPSVVTTTEQSGPLPEASSAVLLLPMLNDYLVHYIDILSSASCSGRLQSPNLSSSSNKSGSCETGSSLESMTSSLGMLLQQGAEYANSVETLTVCALHVLHKLVCACNEVRAICLASKAGTSLLHLATDTSSSTIETDQEKEKTKSGEEGDDERSTTSSRNSSLFMSPVESLGSPAPRLQGLNLLFKLVRLACPSHESSAFKQSIVEGALDVLIALANNSPEADVDRLHVVVLRGVLTECLQLEQQPCITLRALNLFSCLVRSRAIVPFLCNKTDTCTLLNVHLVSTRLLASRQGKQQVEPLMLYIISKVMDCVFSVVSFHRHGVHILTDNNCRCSGQIVPSLVHSMFYLLRDYQISRSQEVFGVLRKGVLLLHDISLQDPNFQQRHAQVHLHYSTLMSGLTKTFKDNKELLPQVEASALEDLWEEVDESDTGSQESDHEEPMEPE